MPHALLSPDLYADETLHGYLRRWGWTCRQWSCGSAQALPGPGRIPHAVIVSTAAAKQAGFFKSPGEAAGTDRITRTQAPAPVLVVGEPDPALAVGISLPDYGHEGSRLCGALNACLALAGPESRPVADTRMGTDILDILGHELRTPLAAIRTALEILAADLAVDLAVDLTADPAVEPAADPAVDLPATPWDGFPVRPQDDTTARMVRIALRNVQRLDRTVDWGQTMLRGDGGCGGSDAGCDADGISLPADAFASCPV